MHIRRLHVPCALTAHTSTDCTVLRPKHKPCTCRLCTGIHTHLARTLRLRALFLPTCVHSGSAHTHTVHTHLRTHDVHTHTHTVHARTVHTAHTHTRTAPARSSTACTHALAARSRGPAQLGGAGRAGARSRSGARGGSRLVAGLVAPGGGGAGRPRGGGRGAVAAERPRSGSAARSVLGIMAAAA